MIYQGPSSLLGSMLLKSDSGSRFAHPTPPISPICISIRNDFDSHIVAECVALFFRWHYPHCMFIDRDEFLTDYLKDSGSGKYSSPALKYSICALGALMSTNVKIRCLADKFSIAAIRTLESESLLDRQDTSIEAILLCSFYQIGSGDFSKAWMLSGMQTSDIPNASCRINQYKASRFACPKISEIVEILRNTSMDTRVRSEILNLDGVCL
jgi:hypothetical protein